MNASPAVFEGDALIEVGRIVARHGLRGETRARLHNPDSMALSRVERVTLRGSLADRGRTLRLLHVKPHRYGVLLRLEGVATVDDATALIGQAVCVRRGELPAPGPKEVYYDQLIGAVVELDTGEYLGEVSEIFPTGSNEVLVVAAEKREYLVPFIEDVVVRVDAAAGIVVIRPIPGLLDP